MSYIPPPNPYIPPYTGEMFNDVRPPKPTERPVETAAKTVAYIAARHYGPKLWSFVRTMIR